MPRPCAACSHESLDEINRSLAADEPLRDIAGRVKISKSSLARHKLVHLPASMLKAAMELDSQRRERLFEDARSMQRSWEGWSSVQTQHDWVQIRDTAECDFDAGRFLIDKLGARRFLDPEETATLLTLRRRIIEDWGLTTAPELMLVDLAIINYANAIRAQEWIGNLSVLIEHDSFFIEGPTPKLSRTHKVSGLKAEDHASRLREQLMPLLEKASRQFIANLDAIRRIRQARPPSVMIENAGQVNVGSQQINSAQGQRTWIG